MIYVDNDKTRVVFTLPVGDISISICPIEKTLKATIITDTVAIDKLETEYRALIQENDKYRIYHNYKECYSNNEQCELHLCVEYRQEMITKYA